MERKYNRLYKNLCGIGAALLCFLLLLPSLRFLPTEAQPVDTGRDHEFDVKIRTFFDSLAKGNSATAFEELLRQSPLASSGADSQSTEQLRNKVNELEMRFGKILHYEKYETKPIGEDIRLVRYILKYEQYPVIWTFTLYRKPVPLTSSSSMTNPWGLVELHFDTNLL